MGEPRRCWLRWHNYSDSVTSALESLRYDEDFLDVTIACDGHSIRAHKLVLSACSAYFKKILKDHPCDHPIIILDGLGWQVIVSLLHFMYCGEVVVEEELLPSLLNAATNLNVTGLTHVTSAIISAQPTKDDSNNEHSVEEEEYDEEEDEDDDDDDDYDDDEQPLKIEEVQKSPSSVEGMDSNEGSMSETEAPPSKRPRKSSCEAQTDARPETHKQKDFDSTKPVSSPEPKESGVPTQKVTNGISPLTLPLLAAAPLVDLPSSDSNKSSRKEPPNYTSESSNDSTDKSKKKVVNGNSSIKHENFDYYKDEEFYDDDSSNPLENGDSDMLKNSLPLALGKSGVILPEGLLESCGVPVGMTAAMGPINYATLLASEGILPSVTSTQGSTVLIAPKGTTKSVVEGKINFDKVVQKILHPPIPASATVALSTVPTVTSGTTPATATCAPPTTTSSLSTSTSGQQYIHPSMVSLQEVQATLVTMPRKKLIPTKKGLRQQRRTEDMVKAISAVCEGTTKLNEAARHFKVPKATLSKKVTKCKGGADPNVMANLKLGRKPIFPEELEEQLVEYCLLMERKFYGLTRDDIRRMAYQLAEKNRINNPFSDDIAGRAWFVHFMHRHKDELSVRKPEGTSLARAVGFNKECVMNVFDLLENAYSMKKYPPNRVYNVDETGLSIVQSKLPHVIGKKGKKQIGALTAAERGSLVTIIACMSAGGDFVPPMMIFPRTNWTDRLMKGAPPGAVGRCHPSGWVQSHHFTDWFSHFIDYTKPSAESPVLLILDGHYSHTRNLDIILKAREHHVTLVCLPPHTSHMLQPLDRAFMGPLKTYYSEEVRQALRTNGMDIYDIAEKFGKAYLKVQTGEIAVKGFKCTGIFPLNRGVVDEVDFVAAEHEEAKATESDNDNRSQQILSTTEGPSTAARQSTAVGPSNPVAAAGPSTAARQSTAVGPSNPLAAADPSTTAGPSTEADPSASADPSTTEVTPKSKEFISPHIISPVPQRSAKARKLVF